MEALSKLGPRKSVVTKVSKFLADLASYEGDHREPNDPRVPQVKGRTAFAVVLGLLLFLAGFAYLFTSASLTSRAINALEDTIFGIVFLVAAIAHGLRWYYARRR